MVRLILYKYFNFEDHERERREKREERRREEEKREERRETNGRAAAIRATTNVKALKAINVSLFVVLL